MRSLIFVSTIAAAALCTACSPRPGPCGPMTCSTGCCDQNGLCQAGTFPTACGFGGTTCQTCSSGLCNANGTCAPGTGGGTTGGGGGTTGGGGGTTGGGATGDGGTDGGLDGGADAGGFVIDTLDGTARGSTTFAIAVDPALQRVGVAYYSATGTQNDAGVEDFDLKYVEWRQGAVVVPPERIRTAQRVVGLSLAFHPSTGTPWVGFLGGAPGGTFWFQSDATLASRNAGTWTETVVASRGDEVMCGNPVSDRGFLVGLWPAHVFDSTGKLYFGYRDGHDGLFPMQDWAGSDVEVWEGTPPILGICAAAGGNNKQGWGGHLRMVMGPTDQPAIVHDQMFGGAEVAGQNVVFQRRTANGSWSAPLTVASVSDTQSGPSLAFDPTEGFGIAVLDRATNELNYLRSSSGVQWDPPDVLTGSAAGTSGWYPSLAMDPVRHEPAIVFYACSPQPSRTECRTSDDQLRLAQRFNGTWFDQPLTAEGGHAQLRFFANEQPVVVYRVAAALEADGGVAANAGALKIISVR